jgi:hypothetical protein
MQQEFRNAARCGDVNFDGVDDFLTGHYTRDAVRFYFGGNPPDSSSSWDTTFTGLRRDMVLLGDINGDHWREESCFIPVKMTALWYGFTGRGPFRSGPIWLSI